VRELIINLVTQWAELRRKWKMKLMAVFDIHEEILGK
jgi:hypothetical protein